jgi:cobyrinic acid a,c-diamide synthase
MTPARPAFLLAATHSGAGKTTVTLGLLAALARQGVTVQPFKCGPDFIDPTLHQMVTGQISRNLDLRMCGQKYVAECFLGHGATADLALVEGVMGLFDGGAASPAALAKALAIPVVLVVDAKASAESIAAVVKGFETLDPELTLMGVIFNRVGSPRHLELLSTAVRTHCRTPILGSLPRDPAFAIADRHLGLKMGSELPLTASQLDSLAEAVRNNIDLAAITRLARPTTRRVASLAARPISGQRPVRIGVARDAAFCFYYQDNLELLQSMGAEMVEFSPLHDQALPPGLDGLYLGGGYPELHAQALAANQAMLTAIRAWSEQGRPLYAECGGLLYLCQGLVDLAGVYHPLTGVFPTRARMGERLASLGYREATISTPCLLGQGGLLFGHEFHYSQLEPMPPEIERVYRLQDGREEGYQIRNTLGSYLHLHFGQTPEAARCFVEGCRR